MYKKHSSSKVIHLKSGLGFRPLVAYLERRFGRSELPPVWFCHLFTMKETKRKNSARYKLSATLYSDRRSFCLSERELTILSLSSLHPRNLRCHAQFNARKIENYTSYTGDLENETKKKPSLQIEKLSCFSSIGRFSVMKKKNYTYTYARTNARNIRHARGNCSTYI